MLLYQALYQLRTALTLLMKLLLLLVICFHKCIAASKKCVTNPVVKSIVGQLYGHDHP